MERATLALAVFGGGFLLTADAYVALCLTALVIGRDALTNAPTRLK